MNAVRPSVTSGLGVAGGWVGVPPFSSALPHAATSARRMTAGGRKPFVMYHLCLKTKPGRNIAHLVRRPGRGSPTQGGPAASGSVGVRSELPALHLLEEPLRVGVLLAR